MTNEQLIQKTMNDLVASLNDALAVNTSLSHKIDRITQAGDRLARAATAAKNGVVNVNEEVLLALREWEEANRVR